VTQALENYNSINELLENLPTYIPAYIPEKISHSLLTILKIASINLASVCPLLNFSMYDS
jgi:hypothetical protein